MIKEFEKLMFNDNDYVSCGSLFENSVIKFADGIGSLFYTINPIDCMLDYGFKEKDKYYYLTPRRADINVSRFSNFMFEMDNISLDDQLKVISGCSIPFTAIVYSGNKSYHALLALDGCLGGCNTKNGIDNYKNVWKRISLKIEEYANTLGFSNVIDQSGKNPSRFTRFPTTIRDNGNEQAIVSLGSRIKLSDFNNLLKSCPKVFTAVAAFSGGIDAASVEDFFEKAPRALVDEFKYPTNISSHGQYARIFRLSMWCVDLGVSKELCLQLFWYKFFLRLVEAGYNENRLTLGIEHAYNKK